MDTETIETRPVEAHEELRPGEVMAIRMITGRWVRAKFKTSHTAVSYPSLRRKTRYAFVNLRTGRTVWLKSKAKMRWIVKDNVQVATEVPAQPEPKPDNYAGPGYNVERDAREGFMEDPDDGNENPEGQQ